MPSVRQKLESIAEELSAIESLVREAASADVTAVDRLIGQYVSRRRVLAEHFMELADDVYGTAGTLLADTREQIRNLMEKKYAGSAPQGALTVRKYGRIHRILLEYLARHRGEDVAASVLRVITGDQVHTERRLRELRDLGFAIGSRTTGKGETVYRLETAEPNLEDAARIQLSHNIEESDRS